MDTALRDRELQTALQICERMARTLRNGMTELSTPVPVPRATNGSGRSDGRVRLSKLAGRLGIDPRTLYEHIKDQDFFEQPVERVKLVVEAGFERWYTERGRKL